MHKTIRILLFGLAALMAFAACGGETEEVIREVPVERNRREGKLSERYRLRYR